MFSLSDRSVKASVPWYSSWKDTLMGLNTSTFYSGILCCVTGVGFLNCPLLFLFIVTHPPFLTILLQCSAFLGIEFFLEINIGGGCMICLLLFAQLYS